MKPVITAFAAANRPFLWKRFYNSIKETKVPFEVIFIGDVRPKFPLPKNFRFIYSPVKPVQCVHIAIREAQSSYVLHTGDDYVHAPRCLDYIMKIFRKHEGQDVIVGPKTYMGGKEEEQYKYFANYPDGVFLPPMIAMPKSLCDSLGGIDSNFCANWWMRDIILRLRAQGGKIIPCVKAVANEKHPKGRRRLVGAKRMWDKDLLFALWTTFKGEVEKRYTVDNARNLFKDYGIARKHGFEKLFILHDTHSSEVVPFKDENLLTASQGPKWLWK